MAFHYDPEVDKRSLMLKQQALCNGKSNGRSCVYYWTHVEKVESANSDNLRRGEIYRACCYPGTGSTTLVHELSAEQLATECNQYKARKLPILQRPLAWLGLVPDQGKYDPHYEDYNPLTPEEIKALQKASPDSVVDDDSATVGMEPADSMIDENLEGFQKELSLDEAMNSLTNPDAKTEGGIFKEKS